MNRINIILSANVINRALPVLFLFLYLLLPTCNPTADAYDYAAGLKWEFDLFEAHHLLHQLPAWIVYHSLNAIGLSIDALRLSTALNAIYCGMLLWVLNSILTQRKFTATNRTLAVLTVALSYGMMRYSTENEVYILPIVISLLGVFYLEQYWRSKQSAQGRIGMSLLTLAIAFHQVQVWWWLAIIIFLFLKKDYKLLIFTIVPVCIVVMLYHTIAVYYWHIPQTIFSSWTLFTDVYQKEGGTSALALSIPHFVLTGIALVRSWIALPTFGITNVAWWIIVSVGSGALLVGLYVSSRFFTIQAKSWEVLCMALLVVFCLFSMGNVEFLTSIPVLTILTLKPKEPHYAISFWVVIGLAAINTPSGLWIPHSENISVTEELYELHLRTSYPALVLRKAEIDAYSYYQCGKAADWAIYASNDTTCNEMIARNICFYTDLAPYKSITSRANMLMPNEIKDWAAKNLDSTHCKVLNLGTVIQIGLKCPQ